MELFQSITHIKEYQYSINLYSGHVLVHLSFLVLSIPMSHNRFVSFFESKLCSNRNLQLLYDCYDLLIGFLVLCLYELYCVCVNILCFLLCLVNSFVLFVYLLAPLFIVFHIVVHFPRILKLSK